MKAKQGSIIWEAINWETAFAKIRDNKKQY